MNAKHFRELLDLAHDAMIIRNLQSGRIEYWNHGAADLYGWTAEEAMGQDPHQLFHTQFPRPWNEIEVELRQSGYWEGELVHHRRDGSPMRVATRRMLHWDQRHHGRIFEINRDVTARTEMIAQLREREQRVQSLLRDKDRFLATVSHELRTPLNAVLGFSALLREQCADGAVVTDQQRGYLEHIQNGGQRLLRLVNDLLELNRLESGHLELNRRIVDVHAALRTVVGELQVMAAAKPVELAPPPASGIAIWADPERLHQILVNLIGNAIKFTPAGGRVWLEVEQLDGQAEITVADTGVGIAPPDVAAAFEEFRQVGEGAVQGGAGLGLAITRRLVDAHGGSIRLQSEPNHGSRFIVSLPVARDVANP